MNPIQWTEHDLKMIAEHGGVCLASAVDAINRSGLTFADIEAINQRSEHHKPNSTAERKYRTMAINKAVAHIASHAKEFID